MDSTMLQLLIPVVILQLVLAIVALVNLIKSDSVNGPKWVWALIILLINVIGPIIYFIFGRRN
ncbi:transcriptional regulator [Halalkalibacillus sediminis]|uniref:Transcriptional regulator n=1 Tax=Halalkalibacillus sediminis TaxID=2018042 RepID=A0A2I0QRK7_9BACI|nr:PLD nuclease N-terminal domain-containing protein [Halalkalibacillus sediminis]PKR76949.1 transcriptional regulator [Halalkalibacillus sediminis]